jgi:hypothetical protein
MIKTATQRRIKTSIVKWGSPSTTMERKNDKPIAQLCCLVGWVGF